MMKSVCIFFALAAILTPSSFGASDKQQAQAQVLDQNEYACENCFFGASTYYYCLEANNKVLIGYSKIPVMNWIDPNKNWLTKVHKAWKPWAADGSTLPIRYDQKHIWISAPDGKKVKLRQDYGTDIFVNNQMCRAAVTKK